MSEYEHALVGPFARLYDRLTNVPADWRERAAQKTLKRPTYEISLEGPAGTGKTFAGLTTLQDVCEHPHLAGIRILLARKTRVSLNESVLQIFEDKVLPKGHPVKSGPLRRNRDKYTFSNGSEIVLGGMDNLERLFSSEYDVILLPEAIEFTLDEYQSLFRALRGTGAPYRAIVTDTNPGPMGHFLNTRPDKEGSRMERFLTRHRHNPSYFDPETQTWTPDGIAYIENLEQLDGVMRTRLLEGQWCAATGVIYDNFDPDIHMVDQAYVDKQDIRYHIIAIDFGYHDRLVMQVWAVDVDRNAYRVWERYGREISIEQSADWLIEAVQKYDPVQIVGDHRPEHIRYLNERLGVRANRSNEAVVHPVKKGKGSVEAGIMLVRDLLGSKELKKSPKAFLVRDALVEADTGLVADGLPTCTEQEIPSYVWIEQNPLKHAQNIPDPGCVDDGCDTERFGVTTFWRNDFGGLLKNFRKGNVKPGFFSKKVRSMDPESFRRWVDENDD